MEIALKRVENTRDIYNYMVNLSFPYNYGVEFDTWEKSFLYDTDGDGRTLFSDLTAVGAYLDGRLAGFIQYGKTAFGFDEHGDISAAVSYSVIRSFYFSESQKEIGTMLLNKAIEDISFFDRADRIYAFFHYFGMSCYARHGKLFEGFGVIHDLLIQSGFVIEHENVFYSSTLQSEKNTAVNIKWHDETSGRQQYCDFIIDNTVVGGCEIHFLPQEDIAYLRWIFIHENLCGKGIGSECMTALKDTLFLKGIIQFDTDTAFTNKAAQGFYEKNSFIKKGITRSYYRERNSQ